MERTRQQVRKRRQQQTTSTLLLFDGLAHTAEGYANLSRIAHRVEALLGNEIKIHLVVSANDQPEQLDWDGSVLLDPERQLHRLYGAKAASLYFIRPDGYIGFRSQPAREEPLLAYLGKLFLYSADTRSIPEVSNLL